MILRTPSQRARRGQPRTGAAAVEFAVIAIPLFTLLVGLLEFGAAFMKQQRLNYACRQAARFASVQGYILSDVQTAGLNVMSANYSNVTSIGTSLSASTPLAMQVYIDSNGGTNYTGPVTAAQFESLGTQGATMKVVMQMYYGTDSSPTGWFLGSTFSLQTTCVMRREL
jgi:Flp pilus assembly protein TadG